MESRFYLCLYCEKILEWFGVFHPVKETKKGYTCFCTNSRTRIFWTQKEAMEINTVPEKELTEYSKVLE